MSETRDRMGAQWRRYSATVVLLLSLVILVSVAPVLPTGIGTADFEGYWAASHLLSRSEDFTDDAKLLALQRDVTNPDQVWVIKSWNPPWLLAWLLPYALVDFQQAARLWLLTSFLLVSGSMILGWRLYATTNEAKRWFWLPVLAAILFPATLAALVYGQVNLLVLVGLVGFLALYRLGCDFSAGLVLALVMAKPHLVFLTVPLVLLVMIQKRRGRVVLGLGLALILSTGVVFLLRPRFLGEYIANMSGGSLLNWETATLTTYLHIATGWIWLRLVGLALLPLVGLWWLRIGQRTITLDELIDISLLLSVITMPFGWSYDFVVLLLPLMRIWLWAVEGVLSRLATTTLAFGTVALYGLFFYQRLQAPSELYFFWVPLAVAGLYGWVWYHKRRSPGSLVAQSGL